MICKNAHCDENVLSKWRGAAAAAAAPLKKGGIYSPFPSTILPTADTQAQRMSLSSDGNCRRRRCPLSAESVARGARGPSTCLNYCRAGEFEEIEQTLNMLDGINL